MRYHDSAADYVGHREDLVHLLRGDAQLVAFPEVILDAIVATKHHRRHEAEHFLGGFIEGAVFVGIGVEVPKPFHHQVVLTQNHFVHPFAVLVEFF